MQYCPIAQADIESVVSKQVNNTARLKKLSHLTVSTNVTQNGFQRYFASFVAVFKIYGQYNMAKL